MKNIKHPSKVEVVLPKTNPAQHHYEIDSLTGLRVTKRAEGAKPVTSKMIKALLTDFP